MKNHYFVNNKFSNANIASGFFTRKNGFSLGNYASLNCSHHSGDQSLNVKKNIYYAQKKLELERKKIKLVNQIHSNKVVIINKKNFFNNIKADGMITQDKDISLAILTADCCPIFIFDEKASFISCLHVGWKGCFQNIIDVALIKIKKIQPKSNKLIAIIGPCLNKENFEVTNEFKKKFILVNSEYKIFFRNDGKRNKCFFNMRGLINLQLKKNKINSIENIDIDTYKNLELFYSHRRSTHNNSLPTGRMINIIGFNK